MPTKLARGRNFCFTLNNYEEADIEKLKAIEWIKYGIVGKEVGSSGTPHLQGYIQCEFPKRAKQTGKGAAKKLLKEGLSSQPHCEVAMGSYKDNVKYCSKDEQVTEWGVPAKTAGARRDIDEFHEAAKTLPELELADKYPAQYHKYWKSAERVRTLASEKAEVEKLADEMSQLKLRSWQIEAIKALEEQNDRQILWYVDYRGGQGKTMLAKYLIANKGAFYMQGGKVADIAHAYKGEDYVVCDFTRDKEETVQYSAIESLKNGIIFSPKYDSRSKIKASGAKIIVFSNWDPDTEKLSEDRWDIRHLERPAPHNMAATYAREMRARAAAAEDVQTAAADEKWDDSMII